MVSTNDIDLLGTTKIIQSHIEKIVKFSIRNDIPLVKPMESTLYDMLNMSIRLVHVQNV